MNKSPQSTIILTSYRTLATVVPVVVSYIKRTKRNILRRHDDPRHFELVSRLQ